MHRQATTVAIRSKRPPPAAPAITGYMEFWSSWADPLGTGIMEGAVAVDECSAMEVIKYS